ncbi:hypothetical protein [Streptomyces albireticuli]|uniref:Head-to-tail stopper n=1 Tax=Streptomyces albireticuli TaxID=1940 RepID=A0A2A2D4D6_9ACTN|nr:hypothetical protein [Streptomyces albireticuli]MCD9196073.1 hypothetical protein [Streptomyces albireticuli]PAU46172.1 hypothetical protein CK936_25595 [Streptomyces albireticuli]
MMFFDQDIVRLRAGTRVDRGGNAVPDWSPDAVSRLAITEVSIQPTTATETAAPERTAVVTGWHVQSQPGTDLDIRAADRIEWDGMILEVDGEIARWTDPVEGGIHHVELDLVRATG